MHPLTRTKKFAGGQKQIAASGAAPALTDDQLLYWAAAGNRQAENALFQRYDDWAFRVAYRQLGNEHDAEDAKQTGLRNASQSLHSFQGKSSFKTWLGRIVENAALDLGRQRGRRHAVSLDDIQASYQPPSREPTPVQAAVLNEVWQVMATWPARERELAEMHLLEHLTIRQISHRTGLSRSTVGRIIQRASRQLVALLLDTDVDPAIAAAF